ncbi:MAG: TrkA family potassium uptake protein [Dictyoglomus sp.]|nr:TrkA family potassium uptake protein [Dictyoglomus sp.]MCX7942456.1 TrkA family potassium uptake protein [Dictyoglomaceae bacterium]MDW8189279.1 TrkA family potassium uptake protein [Dictyoglomus sp.]
MKSLFYRIGLTKERFYQFTVIGLGRFGSTVAITLERLGCSVLAIDENEQKVEALKDYVSFAKVADATNINALRDAGVQNSDVAIIAIANDIQSSVLATLLVKELGVKYVVAKAVNDAHGKILEKIGADLVVFPEKESGELLAQRLVVPNIIDFMELSANVKIFEVKPNPHLIGKTLDELQLRRKYNLNVLAILRGGDIIINPHPDVRVEQEDILYIVGTLDSLNKLLMVENI